MGTAISAAPREVRSTWSHCGASWLKTKCVDCSRNSQQCTEWTLQKCKQCNLGPKAQHNNHDAGDVSPNYETNLNLDKSGPKAQHSNHKAGDVSSNFETNINPGPNRSSGDVSSNFGTNSNGGNNNKGNNNGSSNSGNKNSGNKDSGNKNSGKKN